MQRIILAAVFGFITASEGGEPVQSRPEVSPQPLPEVTIREAKDRNGETVTLKEWRLNGKVLAIKVTPLIGPDYYLVDPDGDGVFDFANDWENDGKVAQWVIWSF